MPLIKTETYENPAFLIERSDDYEPVLTGCMNDPLESDFSIMVNGTYRIYPHSLSHEQGTSIGMYFLWDTPDYTVTVVTLYQGNRFLWRGVRAFGPASQFELCFNFTK